MNVGKKVYVGLESSGKSVLMVRELVKNIDRNVYWQEITNLKRPIYYNLALNDSILEYAESKGIQLIFWSNIWDLVSMTECDLYIDELATYFDSRTYSDLPLDVRLWLAQAEKLGVQIVGATQDYFMIDLSFRRLVKEVFEVRKFIGNRRPMKTAPPIKRIFGIFFVWQIDPRTASKATNQEEMTTMSFMGLPSVKFYGRKIVSYFDTNQRVALSEPPPLRKIVRICPEDNHRIVRYV